MEKPSSRRPRGMPACCCYCCDQTLTDRPTQLPSLSTVIVNNLGDRARDVALSGGLFRDVVGGSVTPVRLGEKGWEKTAMFDSPVGQKENMEMGSAPSAVVALNGLCTPRLVQGTPPRAGRLFTNKVHSRLATNSHRVALGGRVSSIHLYDWIIVDRRRGGKARRWRRHGTAGRHRRPTNGLTVQFAPSVSKRRKQTRFVHPIRVRPVQGQSVESWSSDGVEAVSSRTTEVGPRKAHWSLTTNRTPANYSPAVVVTKKKGGQPWEW